MLARVMTRTSSLVLFLALSSAACSKTPTDSSHGSSSSSASPSGSAAPPAASSSGSDGGVTAVVPALDPEVMALVTPALGCKIESARLVSCPAADEFRKSSVEVFKGEKGDDLVLSLAVHPHLHVRLLATSRSLDNEVRTFAKKENAEKLFTQLEHEKNSTVLEALAAWAGVVDVEAFGLTDRLKALASNSDPSVRRAIGYRLLAHKATPLGYGIVTPMTNDPEKNVRSAAVTGLSNTATFSPSPACKVFEDALGGAHADEVVWTAAEHPRCPGLQAKALAYLDKKTSDPTKITNDIGIGYALANGAVCSDPKARGVKDVPSPTPATRKTAFDIAVRLTSPSVPDSNTRRAAVKNLADCDPARAKAELTKLASDKNGMVADEAKKVLEEVAKKK